MFSYIDALMRACVRACVRVFAFISILVRCRNLCNMCVCISLSHCCSCSHSRSLTRSHCLSPSLAVIRCLSQRKTLSLSLSVHRYCFIIKLKLNCILNSTFLCLFAILCVDVQNASNLLISLISSKFCIWR